MTALEMQLRVSLIQAELRELATRLAADRTAAAKVIRYAARVLGLLVAEGHMVDDPNVPRLNRTDLGDRQ